MVARYQWHGEDLVTDMVSALSSMATGGLGAYLATSQKPQYGVLFNAAAGLLGLIGKNYVGSPVAHEALEGIGFGGFAGLGAWAYCYLANKQSIPIWRPEQKAASMIVAPPVASFRPVSSPIARPVGSSASILEI